MLLNLTYLSTSFSLTEKNLILDSEKHCWTGYFLPMAEWRSSKGGGNY